MFYEMKRLVGRLLRGRPRPRTTLPPPPRFDEGLVFSALRQPSAAAEAWRAGRSAAAWGAMIAHFRNRDPSLGFAAPQRIPALLNEVQRRFPTWRERLLAKVQEDRFQGLAIYDRRAAPLSGSFDWSGADVGFGDPLYVSRPHRFGFLPRWALACHYDHNLVGQLDAVLAGWMAASELPGGHPGFKSSHVVVYRFIALLLAWPFLAALGQPDDDPSLASLQRRALQILYTDSRFLRTVDGSGVGNNHRLAEYLAEWLTAALLPEFGHALDREDAERTWLEELHRQTYEDGGSFEQSVHYQEHACELALTYLLLSRRNGWPIPQRSVDRIERMLAFQLAMAGPALLPLPIGNTTEDPLLPLGVGEGWQCGFLREVQRTCFAAEAQPAPDHDPTRETAFWLLDGALAEDGGAVAPEEPWQDFPYSGFAVLAEPEASARVVFRLGPAAGGAAIGGHSHGDLLSLTLSVGGTMVLAPSGTCSYRFRKRTDLPGQPNLRAYFASARCRSGLFLDDSEPYGPLRGDFRNWRLPCRVEAHRSAAGAAGLTWIEGVVVGEGPYVGQRRGVIHIWGRGWLIYDRPPELHPAQAAAVAWQFAANMSCRLDGCGAAAIDSDALGAPVHLVSCGVERATVVTGVWDPLRGWVSPSYGRMEPAPNLRYELPNGRATAAFFLSVGKKVGDRLEQIAEGEGVGFRATSQQGQVLVLWPSSSQVSEVHCAGVSFRGRLICLLQERGKLTIRALGLTQLVAPRWKLRLNAQAPADLEFVLDDGKVLWPRGRCSGVELELYDDKA